MNNGAMPTKILGPNVLLSTQQQEDKLYVSSITKSAKVRRWLPTEKDVIKMYKEKFSQMKWMKNQMAVNPWFEILFFPHFVDVEHIIQQGFRILLRTAA